MSEEKTLKMRDKAELFIKVKESGKKAWLIATHGVGEHCGRHKYITDLFSESFNILQYDLRGHGQSSGKRAYVEEFEDFYEDLLGLVIYLKKNYHMKDYVLFGHSMGALITSGFLQKYAKEEFYPERVFLSSPPVQMPGLFGPLFDILPLPAVGLFKTIDKSIGLSGLVDLNYLSHNSKVKREYLADELNQTKLHTKLLLEMVYAAKDVYSKPLRPQCPLYVTVGTEDKVIGVEGLKTYFSTIEKAVSLKSFPGAFHEIHNETDKYRKPYLEFLQQSLEKAVFTRESII